MGARDRPINGRYVVADKFIPSGESAFATKAQAFAKTVGPDPQRFGVSREDADAFCRAFEAFAALRQAAT